MKTVPILTFLQKQLKLKQVSKHIAAYLFMGREIHIREHGLNIHVAMPGSLTGLNPGYKKNHTFSLPFILSLSYSLLAVAATAFSTYCWVL